MRSPGSWDSGAVAGDGWAGPSTWRVSQGGRAC